MTVEMSRQEAEILIAVLTFAEGAALTENPSMVNALQVLRPWRSALLRAYVSHVAGGNQGAQEHAVTPSASAALNENSHTSEINR